MAEIEIDNLSIILLKSALITCNYAWCNLWEVSITMKIIFIYTHIIYISLIGFSPITNEHKNQNKPKFMVYFVARKIKDYKRSSTE